MTAADPPDAWLIEYLLDGKVIHGEVCQFLPVEDRRLERPDVKVTPLYRAVEGEKVHRARWGVDFAVEGAEKTTGVSLG
jgi:hypothetical protein